MKSTGISRKSHTGSKSKFSAARGVIDQSLCYHCPAQLAQYDVYKMNTASFGDVFFLPTKLFTPCELTIVGYYFHFVAD